MIGSPRQDNEFGQTRLSDYMVVAAMLLYSAITSYNPAESEGLLMVILSVLSYFLFIYLFFGITLLTYRKRTFLLWGSIIAAVVMSHFLTGMNQLWHILTTWGMLVSGGFLAGRLNLDHRKQLVIYTIACVFVALFGLFQMYPIWSDIISLASENSRVMMSEMRHQLTTLGYSEASVADNVAYLERIFLLLIRLIPATMILGLLMQFSIGYLLFLRHIDRQEFFIKRLTPFVYWKMPFELTPLLIITILGRIFGGETLQMLADNILTILSVYYCLTGLAVCDYFLRKLRVTRVMKILFYILLFFTQIIGYMVTILVGFIDSFTDWRQVQLREIV